MTVEEKLEEAIEKLNKCAFCMGVYSMGVISILHALPDMVETDHVKELVKKLVDRMGHDIEHLFYGAQIK